MLLTLKPTDSHRSLSPSLATMLGVNAAIFLQQIFYWEKKNEKAGRPMWVRNSIREWHEQLPWVSERQLQRIVTKLEAEKLIESRTSGRYNRTKAYRINHAILENAFANFEEEFTSYDL